jgi:hypothetical protein
MCALRTIAISNPSCVVIRLVVETTDERQALISGINRGPTRDVDVSSELSEGEGPATHWFMQHFTAGGQLAPATTVENDISLISHCRSLLSNHSVCTLLSSFTRIRLTHSLYSLSHCVSIHFSHCVTPRPHRHHRHHQVHSRRCLLCAPCPSAWECSSCPPC